MLAGTALVAAFAHSPPATAQTKTRASVVAAKRAAEAKARAAEAGETTAVDSNAGHDVAAAEALEARPQGNHHLDAARVALAKGQLDGAREALEQASAVAGNPTDTAQLIVDVQVALARELARGNRLNDAFGVLDAAALEVASRSDLASLETVVAEARIGLIEGLAEEGKFADAFRELAAAVPAGSSAEARQLVDESWVRVSEILAASVLKVAMGGAHADALVRLHNAVEEAAPTPDAQAVLDRARGEVLQNLADSVQVLVAKGRQAQALRAIDAVLAAPGATDETADIAARSRVDVARSYEKAGRHSQALTTLQAAANTEGISDGLREEIALIRVEVLASLASRQPDEGLRRLEAAAAEESLGKVAEAIALARVGVAKDIARRGRQRVALSALERAASVEGNSEKVEEEIASARLEVARTYAEQNRHVDAIAVLDAMAAFDNPPEVADRIVVDRLEYLLVRPRPDTVEARRSVIALLREEPEGAIFANAVAAVQTVVADVRANQALIVLEDPGPLRPDRPVRLRARVLDPKDEVERLELRYRAVGTTRWNTEPMQRTTGDWNGFIRRVDALAPADRADDYFVEFMIAALNENGRLVDSWGSEEEPALLDVSTARWEEAQAARQVDLTAMTQLPEVTLLPTVDSSPPSPWYTRWYTLAGAGAVVVGAAVVTAVILSRPTELPEHHTRIVLP